jgi:hypothetical protein
LKRLVIGIDRNSIRTLDRLSRSRRLALTQISKAERQRHARPCGPMYHGWRQFIVRAQEIHRQIGAAVEDVRDRKSAHDIGVKSGIRQPLRQRLRAIIRCQ